jgi:N-methylhydantoinase B
MRTYDALMGCLNQAVPGGISACGAGQAGIISAAWTEPDTGRSSVAVVEPFSGGSGGRVKIDGVDANDTMVGFLKSTPIEDVEVDTPLLLRRHELVPESFGHGRHRGGSSVRIEIECLAPEITMTVRGLDRFRFQPWGVFGGTPGRSGSAVLNPGPQQTDLGRIRVLRLVDGDRLSLISPSGGGFGDPLDRPPEQVLGDVERGFLGMETARAIYGVVLRDGAVDADATETRREELRGGRKEGSWVAQGESRRAYEEAWPAEASATLASAILEAPQGRRRFLFTALRKELYERRPLPSPSKIAEAVAHAAKS